jgi:hypothetical protein
VPVPLLLPTSPIALVARTLSPDLFICAKDLLIEAKAQQTPPPLNLMRATGDPRQWGALKMSESSMSDAFDSLDALEKAAVEAALNRCRRLAAQIESKLRNKRHENFVDKLSLADFHASLERAAGVLEQKSRRSVEKKHASAVKGSQTRGRQRHR